MRSILLLCLGLIAAPAQAQVVQTSWVFSAGGALATAGSSTISSVLGDVIIGPTAQSTNGVWSGFYVPGTWPVTGIEFPTSPFVSFIGRIRPNPARSGVSFEIGNVTRQAVDITLYDVSGRRVRHLHAGEMPAGVYRQTWDLRSDHGQRVASGIYFVQMRTASHVASARLVVLR